MFDHKMVIDVIHFMEKRMFVRTLARWSDKPTKGVGICDFGGSTYPQKNFRNFQGSLHFYYFYYFYYFYHFTYSFDTERYPSGQGGSLLNY